MVVRHGLARVVTGEAAVSGEAGAGGVEEAGGEVGVAVAVPATHPTDTLVRVHREQHRGRAVVGGVGAVEEEGEVPGAGRRVEDQHLLVHRRVARPPLLPDQPAVPALHQAAGHVVLRAGPEAPAETAGHGEGAGVGALALSHVDTLT